MKLIAIAAGGVALAAGLAWGAGYGVASWVLREDPTEEDAYERPLSTRPLEAVKR